MTDQGHALEVAGKVSEHVDVLEAGTLLCVAQGMGAIRALKEAHPDKEILADLRIARAGKALSEIAFEAGADIVTCVAEAPETTIKAVAETAKSAGRKVEIELDERWFINEDVHWMELGVKDVICHHGVEVSSENGEYWGDDACDMIAKIKELGLDIAVAGGITVGNASVIAGLPVRKVICGKSIWAATDPADAAMKIRQSLSA